MADRGADNPTSAAPFLAAQQSRSLSRVQRDRLVVLVRLMLPLPSNDADEVQDDQDVDDQSGAFQRARLADQLIEFEWNQERRRDDGQPLGPALPEKEAAPSTSSSPP